MERSLKHMPVLSKKYFHASSPSFFEPYIIGIQSYKYGISHSFLRSISYSSGTSLSSTHSTCFECGALSCSSPSSLRIFFTVTSTLRPSGSNRITCSIRCSFSGCKMENRGINSARVHMDIRVHLIRAAVQNFV